MGYIIKTKDNSTLGRGGLCQVVSIVITKCYTLVLDLRKFEELKLAWIHLIFVILFKELLPWMLSLVVKNILSLCKSLNVKVIELANRRGN